MISFLRKTLCALLKFLLKPKAKVLSIQASKTSHKTVTSNHSPPNSTQFRLQNTHTYDSGFANNCN